jgi:hypothetical protein
MANTKRTLDDFNYDPANEPQWYKFACACERDCGEQELQHYMGLAVADDADCAKWDIGPKQWRRAVVVAFNTLRATREGES